MLQAGARRTLQVVVCNCSFLCFSDTFVTVLIITVKEMIVNMLCLCVNTCCSLNVDFWTLDKLLNMFLFSFPLLLRQIRTRWRWRWCTVWRGTPPSWSVSLGRRWRRSGGRCSGQTASSSLSVRRRTAERWASLQTSVRNTLETQWTQTVCAFNR